MWIVILNFSLFILLIGFMFYGFSKWSKLITEYNDCSGENQKNKRNVKEEQENITDISYYILPIFMLLLGIGLDLSISYIQNWLGY